MKNDQRYLLAQKIALKAGKICLKESQTVQQIQKKGQNTHEILCGADLKVNQFIITQIEKNFPSDKIVSEESKNIPGESEFTWIVDPIDGTNNFSRNIPNYCTAIACIYQQKPLFSVLYAPALGIFAQAYLNNGAFINNKRTNVSQRGNLEESFVAFDLGHKNRGENIIKPISNLVDQCKYMFCYGSYSVSTLFVAMGKIDGYVHNNVCGIWDTIPGGFLVTEAGGMMTDVKGNKINIKSRTVNDSIISNQLIHGKLMANID